MLCLTQGEGEDSCLDTPSMEVCNVTIESTDDISVSVQVMIDYWLLLIVIVD